MSAIYQEEKYDRINAQSNQGKMRQVGEIIDKFTKTDLLAGSEIDLSWDIKDGVIQEITSVVYDSLNSSISPIIITSINCAVDSKIKETHTKTLVFGFYGNVTVRLANYGSNTIPGVRSVTIKQKHK